MPDIIYEWGHYFVWNWLDILWIPFAVAIVHKGQIIKASAYIIVCMMVMRLQIQIIDMMGYNTGVTGWLDWPAIVRGYVVYGFFIGLFLLLSYLSPYTKGAIYLAASLTLFFIAFTISSIVFIV